MKKQKKILIQILMFLVILLSTSQVFATTVVDYLEEIELSEDYITYLTQDGEESSIIPRMYTIPTSTMTVTNPLKLGRMLGDPSDELYSLIRTIPENMTIKNQAGTNSCWTFASLAALESHLALKDYKNSFTPVVYDFSERHMEYATSKTFLNDEINPNGFNREVGDGADAKVAVAYLTNGTGAIPESEMEFVNNQYAIGIDEIENKTVVTQLNDTIDFPSYKVTQDLTKIKQQIKNHITNYGGISAAVHSANFEQGCYNPNTFAGYCSESKHKMNHAVTIVGWDDAYSKTNFLKEPKNDGAWIIKNSYGTEFGEDGFMYISYEDINIYKYLTGITNADTELTYENIYQYDQYGGYLAITTKGSNIMYLATIFDKKTDGPEYITQVSVNAAETYTCKVYINQTGTLPTMDDLKTPVQLKAGETETFDAGYHTLEFLEPVEITSDQFIVILEIQGNRVDKISAMMECNFGEFYTADKYANAPNHRYDNVTVEKGKCFITSANGLASNQWDETANMNELTEGGLPNFDTTIKAFTVSDFLESIQITNIPAKIKYFDGQSFNSDGMIVQANYAEGEPEIITDYTILNGESLTLGQSSVTIVYEGKTAEQPIEVIENTVENVVIKTDSTKTEYWAGDDFDSTGLVLEATYKDGTTKQITQDFKVTDGQTLKNNQTVVTIEFGGKTTTQEITVKANPVTELKITTAPSKTKYVVGQNFNPSGMIVNAKYTNGSSKDVEDFLVTDGVSLKENQKTVTIEFEGQTTTQAITVEKKAVTEIKIQTKPKKTEYIKNKEELDLTGGILEVSYNDGTYEEILMTLEDIIVSGFNNKEEGTQTITLTYQGQSIQFDIKVKEDAKPVNSNFDNIHGNVTRVRAYHFTDTNKKEYTIMNIKLDGIIKATENDDLEYYYYLSSNQKETGITKWVKLDVSQQTDNSLSIEINTADISNYEEVADSDVLYLYIKEVATRNNMIKDTVTSSILLEAENINIEKYVDGEKKADVNSGTITDSTSGQQSDDTLAPERIPDAGKNILFICLASIILVIGTIIYLIYKDIEIK